MYIHPQGWVYFRNHACHVVTDDDIRDPDILKKLNKTCEWLGPPSEAEQDIYVVAPGDIPFMMFVNHDHAIASFKRDIINEAIEQRSMGSWTFFFLFEVIVALD